MKTKLIAAVLAVVTLFTASTLPAGAIDLPKTGLSKPESLITDGSYPMPDFGNVIVRFYQINKSLYVLTGMDCFSDKTFNVVFDSTVQGVVDGILNETGVDFSKIYCYLPQTNQIPEKITTALQIDIPEFQARLKESANKLDNPALATAVHFFAVWMGVIDTCEICCVPDKNNDTLFRISARVIYRDGRDEYIHSQIYYDSEKNILRGKNGSPAAMGFYVDLNQNMTYTGVDVWQRQLGFCLFYDVFCYLTPAIMHYTTERIKFNYDNRDWMIQIWKGRYFITNGSEVGIYNRPEGRIDSVYNCAGDEDMLVMSMELYHGGDLLFYREPTLHWWITGFSISDTAYLPDALTLKSTITFKDEEMLNAFLASLKKKKNIDYAVDDLTVSFVW